METTQGLETEVIEFLKKECPTKDISRFAPLLKIISRTRSEAKAESAAELKRAIELAVRETQTIEDLTARLFSIIVRALPEERLPDTNH
jgi:hypothetical protein